jgi:hypothetical protein
LRSSFFVHSGCIARRGGQWQIADRLPDLRIAIGAVNFINGRNPMNLSSFLCTIRVAISAASICAMLGTTNIAASQSTDHEMQRPSCSNQTLFGDYGAQIEGTVLGPNFTVRGVLLMHFDGKRNLTAKDYVVLNGTPEDPDWVLDSGTYLVNSDCTGTALIATKNPPIALHFVIVNNGKEIHNVVDGNAITVTAYRVR